MKLDEVIHKKRQAAARSAAASGGFSKHAIEQEVERIFKWPARLGTIHNGGWMLDLVVPDGISQEDFEFTERMLKRKLPSLIATHLSDTKKMGDIRYMYPQMKARPGQKIQRGLPPKIRVPIL